LFKLMILNGIFILLVPFLIITWLYIHKLGNFLLFLWACLVGGYVTYYSILLLTYKYDVVEFDDDEPMMISRHSVKRDFIPVKYCIYQYGLFSNTVKVVECDAGLVPYLVASIPKNAKFEDVEPTLARAAIQHHDSYLNTPKQYLESVHWSTTVAWLIHLQYQFETRLGLLFSKPNLLPVNVYYAIVFILGWLMSDYLSTFQVVEHFYTHRNWSVRLCSDSIYSGKLMLPRYEPEVSLDNAVDAVELTRVMENQFYNEARDLNYLSRGWHFADLWQSSPLGTGVCPNVSFLTILLWFSRAVCPLSDPRRVMESWMRLSAESLVTRFIRNLPQLMRVLHSYIISFVVFPWKVVQYAVFIPIHLIHTGYVLMSGVTSIALPFLYLEPIEMQFSSMGIPMNQTTTYGMLLLKSSLELVRRLLETLMDTLIGLYRVFQLEPTYIPVPNFMLFRNLWLVIGAIHTLYVMLLNYLFYRQGHTYQGTLRGMLVMFLGLIGLYTIYILILYHNGAALAYQCATKLTRLLSNKQ
jgi:hypothetical protein